VAPILLYNGMKLLFLKSHLDKYSLYICIHPTIYLCLISLHINQKLSTYELLFISHNSQQLHLCIPTIFLHVVYA